MDLAFKNKSYGADVLRGMAILIVLAYHAFTPRYGAYLPWDGWFRDFTSPPTPQLLWFYPITFGWTGVPLFFVLSGFCIHLSFLRNRSFQVSSFFWRRFWRIYPAYILSVLVFFYLAGTGLWAHSGLKHLLTHVFLVHNFTPKTFFGINPALWSIATEVQLYLLFPLLLAIRSRRGILQCLIITFALGLAWRALAIFCLGLPDHPINAPLTFPLATWFDWTLGAYIAERFFQNQPSFRHRPLLLSFLIPIFIASTLYKPLSIFSFSLASLVFAVILDAAIRVSWKKSVGVSTLAFIGTVSYSLYLWHEPYLWEWVIKVAALSHSLVFAWCLVIILLFLGSWLSFRFIEQVGIKAGDFLWTRMNSKSSDRRSRPAAGGETLPRRSRDGVSSGDIRF